MLVSTLGDYITYLSQLDPSTKVPLGLGNPHSWRGSYDEIAFEPVANTTVAKMLDEATSACGRCFAGWKGGEYLMTADTPINIEYEGVWSDKGLELKMLLDLMFK